MGEDIFYEVGSISPIGISLDEILEYYRVLALQ